uniref:Uncharacterized protein n=1 Tax=Schizaphis graminum TaxID=13262 RepID=A0A2S2P8H0_SCHGA
MRGVCLRADIINVIYDSVMGNYLRPPQTPYAQHLRIQYYKDVIFGQREVIISDRVGWYVGHCGLLPQWYTGPSPPVRLIAVVAVHIIIYTRVPFFHSLSLFFTVLFFIPTLFRACSLAHSSRSLTLLIYLFVIIVIIYFYFFVSGATFFFSSVPNTATFLRFSPDHCARK